MHKRGQITIVIIVAILLLLFTVTGFYINKIIKERRLNEEVKKQQAIEQETLEISKFIELCLEKTAYEGLKTIGINGGYSEVPSVIEFRGTSFWYLDEVNIQPSLNQSMQMLEEYIDGNIDACFDNFNSLKQQGYTINHYAPRSKIIFASDDTSVILTYYVKALKGDYVKEFTQFTANLDVRYRKVYELASQIIYWQLQPSFKFSSPLENVEKFDFQVQSSNDPQSQVILYTITDKTRLEQNENYVFRFASRFNHSDLLRTVHLQDNSQVVPTVLPYTVYSLDRKAQLSIMPGTTFNLNGRPVAGITVQQFYPGNVTRDAVPVHEYLDNSVTYSNITWNLSYPVYQFEPTGLLFNYPQKLIIYWDNDRIPNGGNMGMLYNEGDGWRPIPSSANYDLHYVYSDIQGFSEYTVADCAVQPFKISIVEAESGDGSAWGCIKKILIIVLIVVLMVVLFAVGGMYLGLIAKQAFGALMLKAFFMGGASLLKLAVLWTAAIVGGAYIGSQYTFDAGEDTLTFTATCDQTVDIFKESKSASGKCTPVDDGVYDATAGETITLRAQIKKCKGLRSYLCPYCTLKCRATYK